MVSKLWETNSKQNLQFPQLGFNLIPSLLLCHGHHIVDGIQFPLCHCILMFLDICKVFLKCVISHSSLSLRQPSQHDSNSKHTCS
ncbi:hypothetical protein HKD37_06G017716 [Glycine soja]